MVLFYLIHHSESMRISLNLFSPFVNCCILTHVIEESVSSVDSVFITVYFCIADDKV